MTSTTKPSTVTMSAAQHMSRHSSSQPIEFFSHDFKQAFNNASMTLFNQTIGMPYWDFSLDSQNLPGSSIWNPEYFGGSAALNASANMLPSGIAAMAIPDGPLAGINTTVSDLTNKRTLSPVWRNANMSSVFLHPVFVQTMIQEAGTVFNLTSNFVIPHMIVHSTIGGDMARKYSPIDILFFYAVCTILSPLMSDACCF